MAKVFTVHSVHPARNVYCGWCVLWEKCLLCTVVIMLEMFTVGDVYCEKSVYCAQCSMC